MRSCHVVRVCPSRVIINFREFNASSATGVQGATKQLRIIDSNVAKDQTKVQVREICKQTTSGANTNRRCAHALVPCIVENYVDVDVLSQQPPLSKADAVAFECRAEGVNRGRQRVTRNTDGVYPVFARLLKLPARTMLFYEHVDEAGVVRGWGGCYLGAFVTGWHQALLEEHTVLVRAWTIG